MIHLLGAILLLRISVNKIPRLKWNKDVIADNILIEVEQAEVLSLTENEELVMCFWQQW